MCTHVRINSITKCPCVQCTLDMRVYECVSVSTDQCCIAFIVCCVLCKIYCWNCQLGSANERERERERKKSHSYNKSMWVLYEVRWHTFSVHLQYDSVRQPISRSLQAIHSTCSFSFSILMFFLLSFIQFCI